MVIEDKLKELYNDCILNIKQIHNIPRIYILEIDEEYLDKEKIGVYFTYHENGEVVTSEQYKFRENGTEKRNNGLKELGYEIVYTGNFDSGILVHVLKEE